MSTIMPLLTAYVCEKCGWVDFHPTQCPRCHIEVKSSTFSGEGKVVTFTAIRYPPKGFEAQAPYVVAIIDMEHGPRVIGRVANSPEEMKVGSHVSLTKQDGVLDFKVLT